MALDLELEPVPRDIQRPFEQIAKLFPLGPEDFRFFPQARVYNDANISIANNTVTALTFNTERWDAGAPTEQHSTSALTGRLTCRVPGLYSISGHVAWAGAAGAGQREIFVRLNGATAIAVQDVFPGGAASIQSVTTEYRLAVGDYAELAVFQNSGGALNVTTNANYSPEFSFSWRSP